MMMTAMMARIEGIAMMARIGTMVLTMMMVMMMVMTMVMEMTMMI